MDGLDKLNRYKDFKKRYPFFGFDQSDGVETHVEGYWKDGVFHVTKKYEIGNHE